MIDVRIRDAAPEDAAAVAAIGRRGFPRAHERLLGPAATRAVIEQTYSEQAVAESIARCAADPDAHFFLAERGGRIVGYLHYDAFGPEPELHRIYVEPSETGTGTGTRLMAELHRRIGPGAGYVLMVAAGNEGAVRFYERHGLVEDGRVDGNDFYREHMGVTFPEGSPPVDSLVLRRRPAAAQTTAE